MIMVEGSTHESLEEKLQVGHGSPGRGFLLCMRLQELYSSQNLTIPSPGSVEEEGDKAVDPRLAEAHLPIFDAVRADLLVSDFHPCIFRVKLALPIRGSVVTSTL